MTSKAILGARAPFVKLIQKRAESRPRKCNFARCRKPSINCAYQLMLIDTAGRQVVIECDGKLQNLAPVRR
jgi:hypothetical protein